MFLTFVSKPRTGSRSKAGSRVRHACEHCRLFRVRCDGLRPCARCLSSHRRCIYLHRSPSSPQPSAPSADPQAAPVQSPTAAPVPPPPSSPAASPDSATAFASKINDYFSSIATVVPEQVLKKSPPPQYSAFAPTRVALLQFYVRHLHAFFPVVDLSHLRSLCHDAPEKPLPPLLCAVFALSIQYAACSGLAGRVLGLAIPGIAACSDASLAGYELIARYRGLLSGQSLEPSLTDVQCYVLMSLYLTNAGQLKAAYNLLGSAVRMAFCLDLHRPSPPDRDEELRRCLWWFLVQLDVKCSTLLTRPAAFHRSDITCLFPADGHEASFHAHSVKLTAAVLSVSSASACARQRVLDSGSSSNLSEAHARSLPDQLVPVLEWERCVRRTSLFSDLELDPEVTVSEVEQEQDQLSVCREDELGTIRSMQRVLLKVHYHNSFMGLLRSFIHFPFKSIKPVRSPWIDRHATGAILHALALAATVVSIFQRSDMLYGWCDIYQALWNSLLTMAGFVLSYPLCQYSRMARWYFPKAISVFDMIAPRISTAARFAALGWDLSSRIDRLVEFAEENQREKEQPASVRASNCTPTGISLSNSGESIFSEPNAFSPVQQPLSASGLPSSTRTDQDMPTCEPVPTGKQDDMWSWMDIVDPPNWPDYQDGIDKLFTDIGDLDLLIDEPWCGVQI